MAKACAYLCRQRCFIDGFGEFGEIFGHCFEPTLGGGAYDNVRCSSWAHWKAHSGPLRGEQRE